MKTATLIKSLALVSLFVAGASQAQVPLIAINPVVTQIKPVVPNLPSPTLVFNADLGVNLSCPSTFTLTQGANGHYSCRKQQVVNTIASVCPVTFPNYAVRADGTDLCAKAGVNIPSVGAITGLERGRDFVETRADQTAVANAETSIEQAEAAGNIAATLVTVSRVQDGAAGSRDKFAATFDVFHKVVVR